MRAVTLPPCSVCDGDIPAGALSERDIEAERLYIEEVNAGRHKKFQEKERPFYCSPQCLRVATIRTTHDPEALSAKSKLAAAKRARQRLHLLTQGREKESA